MKNKELQEIQEQFCSCYDKRKLCSYDVEFIDSDTKPLIHQQSRFWFFLSGKALLTINGTQYPVKKNAMVAIMPWDTTIISNVKESLHFIKIVYNSDFLWDSRYSDNLSNRYLSLLNPISEHPVAYLSKDESEKVLSIMNDIKNENIFIPTSHRTSLYAAFPKSSICPNHRSPNISAM